MRFPRVGETFQGKYELTEELGRGGFAAVYRATDRDIGRQVAIKMLSPSGNEYDASHAARFLREAHIVAQLNDPHTITMFDFGRTDEGVLFMVIEYVAGQDLSHVLADGPLEPAVVVHILQQLLQALREAHRAGVLHRDIKPANVLIYTYIDDPWRVKLLDFGIAKPGFSSAEEVQQSLTRTGAVVGTPRYMSPEQLCADPLTEASDIYSLGLLAYEALTGAPAIPGRNSRDVIRRQLAETPLLLPADLAISPALAAIVQTMVARNAEDRFQSADEVLAALANPQVNAPPLTSPPPPTTAKPTTPAIAPAIAPATVHETPFEFVKPTRSPSLSTASLSTARIAVAVIGVLVAGGALIALLLRPAPPEERDVPATTRRANPLGEALATEHTEREPPTEQTTEQPAEQPGSEQATAAAPDGCGKDVRKGLRRVSFGGMTAELFVPTSYDAKTRHPIVMLFHDRTRTGARIIADTDFTKIAEREGLLLVAPNGPGGFVTPWSPAIVPEIADLPRKLAAQYCVDSTKLYGIGHHLGARMLEAVACALPFSAIATSAYRGEEALLCDYAFRPPHLHLVGAKNTYQPIEGGVGCDTSTSVSLATKNELWNAHYGCSGEKKSWFRHKRSRCETHSCDVPYTVCLLDGGRDWPNATPRDIELSGCVTPTADFPMTNTVWKFFEEEGVALAAE